MRSRARGAAPRRPGLRREHRHGRARRGPPHRGRAAGAPAQPAAGPGHRRSALAGQRPTRGRSSRSGCARSCPATAACRRPVPAAGRLLDAGLVPAVPRTGAGSAGEIIPLAHAFGPLAGIGPGARPGRRGPRPAGATAQPTARSRGRWRERGLRRRYAARPRKGIALLAGVPGATALSLRRRPRPGPWRQRWSRPRRCPSRRPARRATRTARPARAATTSWRGVLGPARARSSATCPNRAEPAGAGLVPGGRPGPDPGAAGRRRRWRPRSSARSPG